MQMETQTSSKKNKVLVVDDNLLNRKLASAVLKSCNLDFKTAENGKIAFEEYLTGEYNIILMDIQMPIMNGIECSKQIRKHEITQKISTPIPIIAVTTFSMSSDKRNCFDAGINDILAKPYKTTALLQMISKFIKIE